jgi:F0F1-type ATP synthase assembly protein I
MEILAFVIPLLIGFGAIMVSQLRAANIAAKHGNSDE